MIARLQTAGVICLETFKEFAAMARFTLRDEGERGDQGGLLLLMVDVVSSLASRPLSFWLVLQC